MSTGNWWVKKLGNPAQTPPTVPPLSTPTRVPPMPPATPVQGETLSETGLAWRGGDATRTETARCPNCGSDLYFSRSNGGTTVTSGGLASPAPRCYACGYTPGRSMQGMPG